MQINSIMIHLKQISLCLPAIFFFMLLTNVPALAMPEALAPQTIADTVNTPEGRIYSLLRKEHPELFYRLDDGRIRTAVSKMAHFLVRRGFQDGLIKKLVTLNGILLIEYMGDNQVFFHMNKRISRTVRPLSFSSTDSELVHVSFRLASGKDLYRKYYGEAELDKLTAVINRRSAMQFAIGNVHGINAGFLYLSEGLVFPLIAEILLRSDECGISYAGRNMIWYAMAYFQYHANSPLTGLEILVSMFENLQNGGTIGPHSDRRDLNAFRNHPDAMEGIFTTHLAFQYHSDRIRKLHGDLSPSPDIQDLTRLYGPMGAFSVREMADRLRRTGMTGTYWMRNIVRPYQEHLSMMPNNSHYTIEQDLTYQITCPREFANDMVLKQLLFAVFYQSDNKKRADPDIQNIAGHVADILGYHPENSGSVPSSPAPFVSAPKTQHPRSSWRDLWGLRSA
ncbi:MAG: hypothetical protein JW774_11540 [Candidatus Aureabacteria bacterium]|nr:hypothetical protein [Candidatus Auribacterota bacterium]